MSLVLPVGRGCVIGKSLCANLEMEDKSVHAILLCALFGDRLEKRVMKCIFLLLF